ncbi:MAG: hypothetical protein WD605_02620 [Candidatus Paceibacterota bacterium]
MEEISLKGEKYLKASVIAEKLGYTADYVGQLCRSKQVDATLVGRSWYVSEKSISEHKKSRYRSTSTKSKESIRKIAEERINLERSGYFSKKTNYGQDDSDLIPIIVKERSSKDSDPEIVIRDVVSRKVENKPLNKESFGLTEKYSSQVSRKPTRVTPAVRIVSTRAVDMNAVAPKIQQRYLVSTEAAHRGKNTAENKKLGPALLIWSLLLIVSIGIFLAVVGLEKRVVLIDRDSEVILYNFNLDPFQDYLLSYFEN